MHIGSKTKYHCLLVYIKTTDVQLILVDYFYFVFPSFNESGEEKCIQEIFIGCLLSSRHWCSALCWHSPPYGHQVIINLKCRIFYGLAKYTPTISFLFIFSMLCLLHLFFPVWSRNSRTETQCLDKGECFCNHVYFISLHSGVVA